MEPKLFGLLGKSLKHSFSKRYFSEKFTNHNLTSHSYQNFEIDQIEDLPSIISSNPNLIGLNVTIPYKSAIIPYLDEMDPKAEKIGAINTIRIEKNKLIGYNTDYHGFKTSLTQFLNSNINSALILGTGGASKAIATVLNDLSIPFNYVTRLKKENSQYEYQELTDKIIRENQLIINCTPLGTFPNINEYPNIPFEHITSKHFLYDLVYNPEETIFLKHGKSAGAATINGLSMLELQAEKAWEIWNF